jgi:hypothetical protein
VGLDADRRRDLKAAEKEAEQQQDATYTVN